MKVSKEQVARNRAHILEAAGRLFREGGFDAIGVDAVMKEAGMTHGGFYGHFESKQDLMARSVAHALEQADESWAAGPVPMAALAAAYLSQDQCDNPGEGCALAALGSDVARQSPAVRRVFTDALRTRIDRLAGVLPGTSPAARRRTAIAAWAGLVGAMVLARAVDDPALSREIRRVVVASTGEAGGGKRKRPRTGDRSGRAGR